jgi:hypothetical protein
MIMTGKTIYAIESYETMNILIKEFVSSSQLVARNVVTVDYVDA